MDRKKVGSSSSYWCNWENQAWNNKGENQAWNNKGTNRKSRQNQTGEKTGTPSGTGACGRGWVKVEKCQYSNSNIRTEENRVESLIFWPAAFASLDWAELASECLLNRTFELASCGFSEKEHLWFPEGSPESDIQQLFTTLR